MKKMMTSEDENKVKELIGKGMTATYISKHLSLPYNVVYYYVKKSGYYRCHRYTKEETRFLIENYSNKNADEISRALNIPVESIYNKARSLKLSRFPKE